MDYPDRRHSDCTIAHLGLAGCRECMRLYDQDRASEPTDKAKAREDVSDAGEQSPEPRQLCPSRGGKRVVESPKAERIEVAKAAVEEGVRKEALSAAEKQRRYREKHGGAYRKREAERQRRRRQEQKDG